MALACVPSVAGAAVWYTTDLEAVALGQAGAFVAAPTTLSAAWYNPAGLAQQRGLQIQLEAGLVYSPLTYEISGGPSVVNSKPFLPAGIFGVSYDFGVPNLSTGLVAYVPQSNTYAFDANGPQRFQSIRRGNFLAFYQAMAAYRFFNRLSVGVALGPAYFHSTEVAAVSAALFGDPTDPAWNVTVKTSVEAPVSFSGTVGLSLDLAPWITIGGSVMPGFDLKATGTINITLPPILAAVANVIGSDVAVTFHVPTIARAGVRVRPTPMLALELAGVFENWSSVTAIQIDPNVTVQLPLGLAPLKIGKITQIKGYRDVYSARLGAELQPLRWLTARAGAFIETAGSDASDIDLSAPESFKVGVTCGASFALGRYFSIDAAYGHTFITPVTVTNSTLTVPNVLVASNTKTIGNGVYRFSFDMVHVGVRFRIDPH